MSIRFFRSPSLAAAALLLLAACADRQPTEPSLRAAQAAPAFTTSPSGARLVSNAVKYRDAGRKPATGRAGSAAITARALIGRDMTTELEVSAGPADSGRTASPSLQKLKVTALDYDGTQIFETNHTGLSGPSFSRAYTGLGWNQTLNLQANVTGIDPNRTDVVNATVPVLLRPDIYVYLYGIHRVRVGQPVPITAIVAEMNGHVGARTDCVLYVDGVAVDRALGIWVDAGTFVTCAFTHVFDAEGTPHVEVRAENVNPGDWSTVNNASGDEVAVVGADNYFEYAQAQSTTTYTRSLWSNTWIDRLANSGNEGTGEYTNDGWAQYALAYGGFERGLSGSFTIQASQSSGGSTIHDLEIQVDSLNGYACFSRFDDTAAATFYACTVNSVYAQWTTFRYDRNAGAVTYHSADYGRYWDGATGEEYTYAYNYDSRSSQGTRATFGSDYTFSVRFVTPDTTYATSLTLPLKDEEYSAGDSTTRCSQHDDPAYFIRSCHAYEYRSTSLGGYWPPM